MQSPEGFTMANKIEAGNLTRKGAGRPKGAVNKVTAAAKDAIADAAEQLGGVKRLVAWAKADPLNERAFWTTIYPKLIPVTLAGDKDNPLHTITTIELVAPQV